MENNNFLEKAKAEEKDCVLSESNVSINDKSAVSVPESYYHNITTQDDGKERYDELFDRNKKKTRIYSVISLIIGIGSVLLGIMGFAAILFGALAITFALVSRKSIKYFDGFSIAGLILGIFGAVFGAISVVIEIIIVMPEFTEMLENFGIDVSKFID